MPRLVLIADDDSLVAQGNSLSGDILVSLGDLWDKTIENAFAHHGCRHAIAVKGNHDSSAEFPNYVNSLHFTIKEIDGVLFGGFNGSWKYKRKGHHMFEQEKVSQMLKHFPRVDVFVAHNSPAGIHERDQDVHQGFEAFTEYLKRTKPKYFLHGHQHVNQISTFESTTVIGVFGESSLDL